MSQTKNKFKFSPAFSWLSFGVNVIMLLVFAVLPFLWPSESPGYFSVELMGALGMIFPLMVSGWVALTGKRAPENFAAFVLAFTITAVVALSSLSGALNFGWEFTSTEFYSLIVPSLYSLLYFGFFVAALLTSFVVQSRVSQPEFEQPAERKNSKSA